MAVARQSVISFPFFFIPEFHIPDGHGGLCGRCLLWLDPSIKGRQPCLLSRLDRSIRGCQPCLLSSVYVEIIRGGRESVWFGSAAPPPSSLHGLQVSNSFSLPSVKALYTRILRSRFIPLACLPIKFSAETESVSSEETKKKTQKSPMNYVTKLILLATLIRVYDYKMYIHPYMILFCYCLHIYFALEMLLAMVATVTRVLIRVELEPQFDEPYLATSLQDFWGRRWNLMVSNILRPTVYDPVLSISRQVIARKWAALPPVLATFLVSGLMHELVFYNIGRLKPTGEVMCFFLLHGVSLAMEIGIKKLLKARFTLPRIVSGPLTLAFVITTSFWLFFPPFLRGKADFKGCTESIAFIEFVKNHQLILDSLFNGVVTAVNVMNSDSRDPLQLLASALELIREYYRLITRNI
ncbi:acyl-CoA--sterol O-acyltransferase 1-like [Olea europaea var. sylvestris]|uniref:acyl-CoA--sterol O-acyltransferase 1-like n=1 Tax=Olea europaea var. sylvestris TaxID=158386 RepID=UPI000C1D17CB|nr:acyl-CoA--sterol O-acyltransferase 1-like [Olea europaea var. sylvestris]